MRDVAEMSDEEFIEHLRRSHVNDFRMEIEPGYRPNSVSLWKTFHNTRHRIFADKYLHDHEEADPMSETVWVVVDEDVLLSGDVHAAYLLREAVKPREGQAVKEIPLHRPDLRPIYGGPTLLEALWNEMDRLMEALMTGATAEDGGDKYRAQELAWVLAIVTNPYSPSVDSIRAEAMRRWNEGDPQAQAEFDGDQDDAATRPEGADQ